MKTLKEMLAEARQGVRERGAAEVQRRRAAGEPLVLSDVRDPDEYRDGFIEPATNISRGFLEFRIGGAAADPATPIVLYCQSGLRSMLAAKALKDLGYENVTNLQGGFQKWAQSGLPVVKDRPMNADQIQRYSRHFLLNQVGEKGQRKLLRSKVLLIGAGGLGSPTALYLAAAGVGTLGLMDGDVVDLSNLQRQILHSTATVGLPKVESGRKTLSAINPEITIKTYHQNVDSDNILPLISQYDMVLDGSDNFGTRFLVNDACFFARKTLVSASMFRFEGQLTTIKPHAGYPCYRCLYPEPPPAGLVPNCQEAGVLGVLAGTMGILQASEAIKEILGIGETIADKLQHYDALEPKFQKVGRPKDPACPLCGPNPKIKDLSLDYTVTCTI